MFCREFWGLKIVWKTVDRASRVTVALDSRASVVLLKWIGRNSVQNEFLMIPLMQFSLKNDPNR